MSKVGLFYQFFLFVLKAAYNDSIFLVTLYFSTSFLSDALQKLIVHLQHSLLAMQDIILTKQLLLSRNLLVHQSCFSYDLLRQKRFFIAVCKLSFQGLELRWQSILIYFFTVMRKDISNQHSWFWYSNPFITFKISCSMFLMVLYPGCENRVFMQLVTVSIASK